MLIILFIGLLAIDTGHYKNLNKNFNFDAIHKELEIGKLVRVFLQTKMY